MFSLGLCIKRGFTDGAFNSSCCAKGEKMKKSSEIESHGNCIYFIDLLYLLVDESNSIYYRA